MIDWWKVNFDLIGLLDSYRTICFYGGGAKVTEQYSIYFLFFIFAQEHAKHGPEQLSKEGQFSDQLLVRSAIVSDFDDTVLCPNAPSLARKIARKFFM